MAELARLTAAGRTLCLRQGSILLVTGPNGSGKSSLLRALAGLPAARPPEAVQVGGRDPAALPAQDLPASLVAQDPRDGLAGLTVAGEFALRRLIVPAEAAPLRDRDVASLSSGEARRVAEAVALASRRPLLLLDEPAEGLDAAGRAALREAVLGHARTGAVVAADHSSLLEGLATDRLLLGPADAPPLPSVATPPPLHRLRLGATTLRRGGSEVRLPSVDVASGLHAVVGRNGSGKSTLLLALAGLLPAQAELDGTRMQAGTAGLLLPRARLQLWQETVREAVAGADPGVVALLVPPALLKRSPLVLSGGEAQRVALACVLGRERPLYLLDEPEAHLDAEGRHALAGLLARRVGEGAVVLAATHDPAFRSLAHSSLEVGT